MKTVLRTIHDVGLAVWWGGSFMGTLAMNPAVEVLDDPEERAKMVDEGWALFQPWATGGLLAAIISHIMLRRRPPKRPSPRYKTVARVKDLLYGVAVASSVASMALGEYVVHQEPEYSPIEEMDAEEENDMFDGSTAQKSLTTTAVVQLMAGFGIFLVGAILASEREK
jgi:hypothetical protein